MKTGVVVFSWVVSASFRHLALARAARRNCGVGPMALAMTGLMITAACNVAAAPAGIQVAEASLLTLEPPVIQQILKRAETVEQRASRRTDAEHAYQLYCKAARLGSIEAQYRMGKMLLEGRGIARSVERAATLFSIAAGSGHERAAAMLAITGVQRETQPECLTDPESCNDGRIP